MRFFYFLCFCLILTCFTRSASSQILPLSHERESAYGRTIYSLGNKFHSSIHSYFQDELDSLGEAPVNSLSPLFKNRNTFLYRKLFSEHLVEIEKPDYALYLDFLPDFQIGRAFSESKTTWLNTRGLSLQGRIGDHVYFYTDFYENQASLPQYLDEFARENGILPGQGKYKPFNDGKAFDWAYAQGFVSYTPSSHFNFQLGNSKQFIGDGYRSLLLSDATFNYPSLKVTTSVGPLRYLIMWAQFQDMRAPEVSFEQGYRKKWGVIHYLDWNISDRVSVGVFESIIWQNADSTGKRGFDVKYLNPIIFFRPVEFAGGNSPDNVLIGINAKVEPFDKAAFYGQLALDEFKFDEVFGGEGWWANKHGIQLGFKAFDLFRVKDLNWLLEFNTVRPYMYSQSDPLINYGHYNQPLAHPQGANFRELLSVASYNLDRWRFRGQLVFSRYGLDPADSLNYGKDIYKSYQTRVRDYGNHTLQGLKTNLYYGNLQVGYLLNPKNNLRLQTGLTVRRESGQTQSWFSFGLSSSFRNIYQDF